MTADHDGKFLASTKQDPAFVSRGFVHWKNATIAFKKHQSSDCHKEATEAIVTLPQQVHDVGELLCEAHREEKATNRRMLLKILQCIQFLAHQGLPLRGVGADADSHLLQLLQLRCVDCPELSVWLSKETDKYTSHDIQNEMIKIMGLHILRQVCEKMRDSGWYTIMADECTDVANKEQLIHYLHQMGRRGYAGS